jgi:hypothetical protein
MSRSPTPPSIPSQLPRPHQEQRRRIGTSKAGGVWKRAYGRVDPHGHPVVPFSEATYRRLTRPAMELLHKLAEQVAGPGGVSRASFVAGALQALSVRLCRGIFFMYRASVGMLAKVSGMGFRAVMDVPTDELVVYLGCCFWRRFHRPLYVYVLCCPVCSFPLCMALPSVAERPAETEGVVLNASGCCVCYV